jgi:DNA-binding response OmpR family regulator
MAPIARALPVATASAAAAIGCLRGCGSALAYTVRMVIPMSSRTTRMNVTMRTALVVEDDPHLQKAMSRELERMSFHVLSANHYDAAVRHLQGCEPHVVCLDVGLPDRSGYELCEHIRGSLGLLGLPILMTSDYGSPGDMAYAEDAGGNAFLRKPFSMQELTDCVESLLNPARSSGPPIHELQTLASKVMSDGCVRRIDAHDAQAFVRRAHRTAASLRINRYMCHRLRGSAKCGAASPTPHAEAH